MGLLVARNVEKAPNGRRRGSDFGRNQNRKVNATEFAKMGGPQRTTAKRLDGKGLKCKLARWCWKSIACLLPLAALRWPCVKRSYPGNPP